jgi:hypothetical protein
MRTINTYDELKGYINAFGKKNINLLIVLSKGGLGKTTLSEEILIEQDPLVCKGHITPLQLYRNLYLKNEDDTDFLIILDDVDSLLANKINIAILKQVCETKEKKMVHYRSSTHLLKDVKPEFETSCKVLVLLNDISTFSENKSLKALITRAHILEFDPRPDEVIQYMQKYAKDNQIMEFIKRYSPFAENLNLRTYEKAKELKTSKLNWEDEILSTLEIDKRLFEIDYLLRTYKTDNLRLKNFSGSRAVYFRCKKKLLSRLKKVE